MMLYVSLCSMMAAHLYNTVMLLYVPFQTCFGLSNTEIAKLLSVYSVTTIPISLIFGRISDAVSPKFCMYSACFISAALGTMMCFEPSFNALLFIFALMPCTGVAWTSTVKIMKYLTSNDKLGKVFGISNTFDGLISAGLYMSFVLLYGDAIGEPANFRVVLWVTNIISLAAGIIVFFFLDYKWIIETSDNYTVSEPVSFVQSFVAAARVPEVWAVGIMSVVWFGITCIVNYTSPYLINGFGFPVAYTTMFAIFTRYFLKSFAGAAGGAYRDKKGAMFRILRPMSMITSALLIAMAFLPMRSSLIVPAIILGCGLIFAYLMLGTAASMTLTEYNPPANLHATMTALVSIVGNIGTIVVSNICGPILDSQPISGYRYVFLMGVIVEMIFFFTQNLLAFCAKLPGSMHRNRADHAFDLPSETGE